MRLSRTRHRRRELHRRLQTRPRILAEYIRYGSDGSTLAFLPTTARTTDLWLKDSTLGWQQFGNGEVGIIDGAVWCQPAATNYTDGTDDLSGGPETVDLTSPGTGNYTLSVIGTAAVTVAAGTAVGTGFGQATEGSPVTFNLSSAGTVTLTLDSGTLDTIGSSAAKQIEKNPFATSFIPTPAGTPVAVGYTQAQVSWPSGAGSGTMISLTFTPTASRIGYSGDGLIFCAWPASGETDRINLSHRFSDDKLRVQVTTASSSVVDSGTSLSALTANQEYTCKVVLLDNDFRLFLNGTKVYTDTNCTMPSNLAEFNVGWAGKAVFGPFATTAFLGKEKDLRFARIHAGITDSEVLAL